MRELLYLKALIFVGVIPCIIISFFLHKKKILQLKSLLISTVLFFVTVVPIDIYLVKKQVWIFNPDYLIGIWFFGMPLEEYLFYFTVNPLVVVLFLFTKYFFNDKKPIK